MHPGWWFRSWIQVLSFFLKEWIYVKYAACYIKAATPLACWFICTDFRLNKGVSIKGIRVNLSTSLISKCRNDTLQTKREGRRTHHVLCPFQPRLWFRCKRVRNVMFAVALYVNVVMLLFPLWPKSLSINASFYLYPSETLQRWRMPKLTLTMEKMKACTQTQCTSKFVFHFCMA